MKKRITATLLTAALVISMSILSFAAIQPHLSININPTDATYTLTATAEGAGDAPTYQWYECGANGENPVAIEGANSNVYQPTVAMDTKYFYCQISNGEESANTEVASISDTSASKKPDETQAATNTEGNVVSTFSVAGIEAPVTGEIPDQTGEIVTENDSPGFYILSIRWDTELPTFVPETAYTATVLVNLSDGFHAADAVDCYIDNNPATIVGDPSTGSFAFYYTFPPTAVEKEEVEGNPFMILFHNVKDKVLQLPSPLGIPAWIWCLAALILLIALLSAITAHSRARKYERPGRDYLDDVYEETMKERQHAEEYYEEEYEEETAEPDSSASEAPLPEEDAEIEEEPVYEEEAAPEEEAEFEEAPEPEEEAPAPEEDAEAPEEAEPEEPEEPEKKDDEPIESIYGK